MTYTTEDRDKILSMAVAHMSVHSDRQVEVYRSSDMMLTGRYFGNRTNKDKPLYFEIVVFRYKYGQHQVYIRYPGCPVYVELLGGAGSSHGNMENHMLRDVLQETINPYEYEGKLQPKNILMYKHENDLLIKWQHSDFNFLKRVAINNFSKNDLDVENSENKLSVIANMSSSCEQVIENFRQDVENSETKLSIIANVFSSKYVPLPDKRRIEYAYYTEDGTMIIVDSSAFNYQYETLRCHFGNLTAGMKHCVMSDFVRYRDGGTTMFDIETESGVRKFCSPTSFDQDKFPTLDDKMIFKMPAEDLAFVVKYLGIDLVIEVDKS